MMGYPSKSMATLLCLVIMSGASHQSVTGAMPDKSPPATPSRLRDDLLLKGLPQSPVERAEPTQTPIKARINTPPEGQQDRNPQPEAGNLLPRIGNQMRQVQQLLSRRDMSQTTQTSQQRISGDLQQVIQQLQKECSSKMSAAEERSTSAKRSAKPGNKPGEKPGKQAARIAGPAGKSGFGGGPSDALQRAMSEFWGHLPTRYRQQMRDVRAVEFLPEYQKLIEEYYKRLAEQPDSQP